MAARRTAPEPIETHEQAHAEVSTLMADANNMACLSDFLGSLDRSEIRGLSDGMADTLQTVLFDWLQDTANAIEERAGHVMAFLEEKRKVA